MKFQNNYCPLCNKIAKAQMGGLSAYWFCSGCLLGRIKKMPRTDYKETYYTSGSSFLSKLFMPLGDFFFRIRESYVGTEKKNLWIDVGAGEGSFLEKITAKKKIGVEISRSGRGSMRRKKITVMTNDEFLRAKKLNADVISFWHVLEHVDNPFAFIRAAERNLSSSGKLVIAVPNIASYEFEKFGTNWFHLAPLYHVWFYSPSSMRKILQNSGLTTEKIDYWAIEHHFTGLLQSIINKTTGSDNILHKLIRRKQDLSTVHIGQILWILFWCTLGLPGIILFWIMASITKKSGAFVLVASRTSL